LTLAVETRGQGPDLALLHGWGFDRRAWDDVVARLAGRFRVHAIDLPGHGESLDHPAGDLDEFARAVIDVLPPHAALAGWSLGALVALRIAALVPERIRSLGLVAATPRFTKAGDWQDGLDPESLVLLSARWSADPEDAWREFRHLVAAGSPAPRELLRTLPGRPASTGAMASGLAVLSGTDLRGGLADLAMPTLVIHGARDALVPVAAGRFLAAAIPGARIEVIADAGHALLQSHAGIAGAILERIDE